MHADSIGETHIYTIEIRGAVDGEDINASSPVKVTVAPAGPGLTLITACTDQSGLIGLIRHLHNLGFVLRAVLARETA